MENLITIILVTCFACVFAEFSGVMQWAKHKTNIKSLPPFDCAKCLAFWTGLIAFTIQGDWLFAIYYASICMVLAIYIIRYAK